MKFDFVIGNPPYQDETIGENDTYAPPVYNLFMDEAYRIGEKVELIHPARFLFNAGSTPKAWNRKILSDAHFKIMYYEANSAIVFSNTDIKGGIAISYRDDNKYFGAIDIFTPYEELNSILQKVKNKVNFESFSSVIVTSYAYHFTERLHKDYQDLKLRTYIDEEGKERPLLSKGHEYDLKSNILDKLPEIFFSERPKDGKKYIKILGRSNNERQYRYINAEYVNVVSNLYSYKAFLPGATGTGQYGEAIAAPFLGYPGEGTTETFMSIGNYESEIEANNTIKYIKTKFTRAMCKFRLI